MSQFKMEELKADNGGKLPAYAWPGGYPIYYICKDFGSLCVTCANDPTNPVHFDDQANPQWQIVDSEINWEDAELYCEHCNKRIESAYAEPEDK